MNDVTETDVYIVYIMVLPNGTAVPKVEYDELRREVEDAIGWLPFGVPCSIENLVTPKFWLPKRNRRRRDLGRCLAYWVAKGALPLEFVGPAVRTNKRYRLRE